jgi:hypothetical protein
MNKELFYFLKYGNLASEELVLSNQDEKLYSEFERKLNLFNKQFKEKDPNIQITFSSLYSMFGFSRHYCAMTGTPIIGRYYKLDGKIMSKDAYEAYQIVKEMASKDNMGNIEPTKG